MYCATVCYIVVILDKWLRGISFSSLSLEKEESCLVDFQNEDYKVST